MHPVALLFFIVQYNVTHCLLMDISKLIIVWLRELTCRLVTLISI